MVKKALLIGINYYSVPSARLNGCINDITNMKNTLITNYGYTENNITVLRDDINNRLTMPTATNILNCLMSLIYNSAKCEEIWIHYSGHGGQIRDKNGDEASGLDSVIVPVDFMSVGVIPDDYIYNIVRMSRTRTIMLFDSCNSGTVCDLIWNFEYLSGTSFSRTKNNNLAIANQNIFMISGSKDTQTSADIYDNEDNQYEGAFTNEFLRALKTYNYTASIFDVYKTTCNNLLTNGYSQKPILSTSSATPVCLLKKTLPVAVAMTTIMSSGKVSSTKPVLPSTNSPTPSKSIFMGGIITHSHSMAVAAKP